MEVHHLLKKVNQAYMLGRLDSVTEIIRISRIEHVLIQ